jgi:hypothetical protein
VVPPLGGVVLPLAPWVYDRGAQMINWPEIMRPEEDSADNQNDEGVRVLVGNLIVRQHER